MKYKKSRNIRDLRKIAGLTQEQLAKLAGLSSVYISHIENGTRPLTDTAAKKIAEAFSKLLVGDDHQDDYQIEIDHRQLRIGHMASFQPKNIQNKIIQLLEEIEVREWHLEKIIDGEEPNEVELEKIYNSYEASIDFMIDAYAQPLEVITSGDVKHSEDLKKVSLKYRILKQN